MLQPTQSRSQCCRIEVHQQSHGAIAQFEVSNHLSKVDGVDLFDILSDSCQLIFWSSDLLTF
jgi:hypothetical protein